MTRNYYAEAVEIRKKIKDNEVITDDERQLESKVSESVKAFEWAMQLRGKRYKHCSFENYQIQNERQRDAVDKLRDYAINAEANIAAGKNIIMYGAKGSGKDHLLAALARACVVHASPLVYWWNGADLFTKWRTEAAGERYRDRPMQFSEGDERESDILWLSDPTSPSGHLSDFVESRLFSLIDYRYSDMKPTWITANVADANELSQRIGSAAADRLRQGCLAIYCDWPSYRTGE